MEMYPKEMERWGTASIFKESARLLRKHYRLFLPFFLAFYLPSSIAPVLSAAFLLLSSRALLDAEGFINIAQSTNPKGDQSLIMILSLTFFFLTSVVGVLTTGAVSYITAYLYTSTDTDDDHSIVPKVFRFLPHAFLRIFITDLWIVLVFLLLCFFILFITFITGVIFNMNTMSATASLLQAILLFFVIFALFLSIVGLIYLTIVFALAQVIAVVEPGNYGRKALNRSTKLARIGRVWTIVTVTFTGMVLSRVLTVPNRGITSARIPMWAEVVLGVVIGGADSVFRVYVGVVSVVMYFVYKARFDAAERRGV